MDSTISRQDIGKVVGLILGLFVILPLVLYGLSEARQAAEDRRATDLMDDTLVASQDGLDAVQAAMVTDKVDQLFIGATKSNWSWYQAGLSVNNYQETKAAVTEFCDKFEALVEPDKNLSFQSCNFYAAVRDGWVTANKDSLRVGNEPADLETLALGEWLMEDMYQGYKVSTLVQLDPSVVLVVTLGKND